MSIVLLEPILYEKVFTLKVKIELPDEVNIFSGTW